LKKVDVKTEQKAWKEEKRRGEGRGRKSNTRKQMVK
jgi:hypothetical protein